MTAKLIKLGDLPDHAKYGPSSMDRILACPGSVSLSEQAPHDVDSAYAAEGTQAHEIGERALLGEYWTVEDMLSLEEQEKLPSDMIGAVNEYVDYCMGIKEMCEMYGIEEKLVLNAELFGTVDFLAVSKGEIGFTLHVVDYKHGAGVKVSPDRNKQLMTYAALAMHTLADELPPQNIAAVELTIIQPRTPGDAVATWVTDADTILKHMVDVGKAIEKAEGEDPEICSGDHCRWCRAKVICPELKAQAEGVMRVRPNDMDPAELAMRLEQLGPLKKAIAALEEYAMRMAEDGHLIPGFKLVDKRATAQWKDLTGAETFLRAQKLKVKDILPAKLVTPAQARKLLKGEALEKLEALIESKSSGHNLVPDTDGRQATHTAGSMKRAANSMAALNKLK